MSIKGTGLVVGTSHGAGEKRGVGQTVGGEPGRGGHGRLLCCVNSEGAGGQT